MRRLIWIGLFAICPGCAVSESSEPGGEEVVVPATLVIAVAEDGNQAEVREPIDAARLIGQYYVGDGAGYNLDLDLRAGGTFDCTWRGCLGVYGTSAGTWAIGPEGVTVTAVRADGMLRDKPLDRLRVATLGTHVLLVPESHLDLFERWGPSPRTCLHQESAGAEIDLRRAAWFRDESLPRVSR